LFDPDDCPDMWPIFRQDPNRHPVEGPVEITLYRTRDDRFFAYRMDFDPFREDGDYYPEFLRKVSRDDADRMRAEIGAVSRDDAGRMWAEIGADTHDDGQHDLPPIVCSQAWLAEQLGYKKGYTKLIARLKAERQVSHYEQVSANRWWVWLRDPVEHRRVLEESRRRKT
jgi:hypothetical protein